MERFETEVTFRYVDPELVKLLTGDSDLSMEYGVEVWTPIKRKWWQWLLRRPRQWNLTVIPRAAVVISDDGEVVG